MVQGLEVCLEEVGNIPRYFFVSRRDVDGFTTEELDPTCPSFLVIRIVMFDDVRDISNRDKNVCAVINGSVF